MTNYITPEDTIISLDIDKQKDFEDFERTESKQELLMSLHFTVEVPGSEYKALYKKDKYIITNNKYLVKVFFQDKPHDIDAPINEAFVGIYGVNKLDNSLKLFFSKVVAILFDREYLGRKCDLVYYEYIRGVPLEEYLLSNNYNDNICIVEQLFLILYHAYTCIGFTHYDLHKNNIIIKELSESTKITIGDSKHFLTKYIPVIIDYGFSHINHSDSSHGRYLPEGNIENNSFWVHDIFKILMDIYILSSLELNLYYIHEDIKKVKRSIRVINLNISNKETINKMKYQIQALKTMKTRIINLYQKNNDLQKFNATIGRHLSFFTGDLMTTEMFLKYNSISRYNAVGNQFKFKDFDFKTFIDFALRFH